MRLAIQPATQPWAWSASAATTSTDVCSPSGKVVFRNSATRVNTIPAIRPATRPVPILLSTTNLLLLRRHLLALPRLRRLHDPLCLKLVVDAYVGDQHPIPGLESVEHGRHRLLDGENDLRHPAVGD